MPDYLVEWDIDVFNATTPRDAAMEALTRQRNPESNTTIFRVTDTDTGAQTVVDLGEQPAVAYPDKEFKQGYDDADITPIELIMPYIDPTDEYQRGWNENITDRFPRRTCPGGCDK